MIAVHNRLISRALKVTITCVEHPFVDIRFGHRHLIVGFVYMPPGSDPCVYDSHCRVIEEVFVMAPSADFLIAEDFNLPHTFWHNDNGFLQFDTVRRAPI